MGVLPLLDEECSIQAGSDDNFSHKLRERHSGHRYFCAPKRYQSSFTIKHYAGDVTYASKGCRNGTRTRVAYAAEALPL